MGKNECCERETQTDPTSYTVLSLSLFANSPLPLSLCLYIEIRDSERNSMHVVLASHFSLVEAKLSSFLTLL